MFIHFEFQVGFWNYEAKTKKHTGEIIFILKIYNSSEYSFIKNRKLIFCFKLLNQFSVKKKVQMPYL